MPPPDDEYSPSDEAHSSPPGDEQGHGAGEAARVEDKSKRRSKREDQTNGYWVGERWVRNYKGSRRPARVLPEFWKMMSVKERSREAREYQERLGRDVAEGEAMADALPAELVTDSDPDSGTELAKPLVQKDVHPLELEENLDRDYDCTDKDRITRIHHALRIRLYTPSEKKLKQWGLGVPMTRRTVIEMGDGSTREITHSYEDD